MSEDGVNATTARAEELKAAGVPERLAHPDREPAGARRPRPTSCWSATAPSARIADVARDLLRRARLSSGVDRIADAAREIAAADYFDRLALDRSRDSLGEATRQLTAEMLAGGKSGKDAVDAWVKPRAARSSASATPMHEIADTGLTLSKLSVAASLLGDLAGSRTCHSCAKARIQLIGPRLRGGGRSLARSRRLNAGNAGCR